ncbi:hypothetical protein CPC16_003915, partial [Podila verticillata]
SKPEASDKQKDGSDEPVAQELPHLPPEFITRIMNTKRPMELTPAAEFCTDGIIVAAKADRDLVLLAFSVLMTHLHYPMWRTLRIFISAMLVTLSDHHTVDTSNLIPLLIETTDKKERFLDTILKKQIVLKNPDNRERISFQYDIVPLLGLLTRRRICNNPDRSIPSKIYRTVLNHHAVFFGGGVLCCLEALVRGPACSMQLGSVFPPNIRKEHLPGDKDCIVDSILIAIVGAIRLLYQVSIHADISSDDHLEASMERLKGIASTYLSHPSRPQHDQHLVYVMQGDLSKLSLFFEQYNREHNHPPRHLDRRDFPDEDEPINPSSIAVVPTEQDILHPRSSELPAYISPHESATGRLSEKIGSQLLWYKDEYMGQVHDVIMDTIGVRLINSADLPDIVSIGSDTNVTEPVDTDDDDDISDQDLCSDYTSRWVALDIPQPYFASFKPVLSRLQEHYRRPELVPFGSYIAPTLQEQECAVKKDSVDIPLPQYARAPGFALDLTPIAPGLSLDPADKESIKEAVRHLELNSEHDHDQAQAVIDSLSREVSLVKGPPGTGKSRVVLSTIKVLIHNWKRIGNGPIIVVSHSNISLDDMLEKIIQDDTTDQGSIVRMGTQSHSELLKKQNIQQLTKDATPNIRRVARKRIVDDEWQRTLQSLESLELALRDGTADWNLVKDTVKMMDDHLSGQFYSACIMIDNRGKKKKMRELNDVFKAWKDGKGLEYTQGFIDSGPIVTSSQPIESIWSMELCHRQELLKKWTLASTTRWTTEIIQEAEKAKTLSYEKDVLSEACRVDVLRGKRVIGLTSNGLARHSHIIEALEPKIIVFEEAGRMFEAHTIAALNPCSQHIILLGDPQQLPPAAIRHVSSPKHPKGHVALDRSLFAALLDRHPPLPRNTLTVQRRMAIPISDIVKILYSELVDDDSVLKPAAVSGIVQNIQFTHHEEPESLDPRTMSIYNTHEADRVVAAAVYLYLNGYSGHNRIAIITPYRAQLNLLQSLLSQYLVPVE